jgi:hypothetical protein
LDASTGTEAPIPGGIALHEKTVDAMYSRLLLLQVVEPIMATVGVSRLDP